jgi:hypothetical protein
MGGQSLYTTARPSPLSLACLRTNNNQSFELISFILFYFILLHLDCFFNNSNATARSSSWQHWQSCQKEKEGQEANTEATVKLAILQKQQATSQ